MVKSIDISGATSAIYADVEEVSVTPQEPAITVVKTGKNLKVTELRTCYNGTYGLQLRCGKSMAAYDEIYGADNAEDICKMLWMNLLNQTLPNITNLNDTKTLIATLGFQHIMTENPIK